MISGNNVLNVLLTLIWYAVQFCLRSKKINDRSHVVVMHRSIGNPAYLARSGVDNEQPRVNCAIASCLSSVARRKLARTQYGGCAVLVSKERPSTI